MRRGSSFFYSNISIKFIEGIGHVHGLKTTVFLKVVGAGHYLPEYAGNLDIMTSAAMATGERMIKKEVING